jgi:hypothetical protein
MRIQMREHGVERGIHQLLIRNGPSIDVVLADQLNRSREAGDCPIVNSVIVCFGAGTQYSDPDPQVQEDANSQEAVENLPLHANATLARPRLGQARCKGIRVAPEAAPVGPGGLAINVRIREKT